MSLPSQPSMLYVPHVANGSESDLDYPLNEIPVQPYPYSNHKGEIWTEDENLEELAQSLGSQRLRLSDLKLDGWIAELKVADGVSLNPVYDESDRNIKWAATFYSLKNYPDPILKGFTTYIPFFKLERLYAWAPYELKTSFTSWLYDNKHIDIQPSELGNPFLAQSGNKPIDWEWIVEWAAKVGLETMVLCRFGENTDIVKAGFQLQPLCEAGGGENNVFDISRDCSLGGEDVVIIRMNNVDVQIRNLFAGLLSDLSGLSEHDNAQDLVEKMYESESPQERAGPQPELRSVSRSDEILV